MSHQLSFSRTRRSVVSGKRTSPFTPAVIVSAGIGAMVLTTVGYLLI